MDNQTKPTKVGSDRWSQVPWWAWLLIILFPIVLRPWWVAIVSVVLFVLFLRLILGPFQVRRNSNWPATHLRVARSRAFLSAINPRSLTCFCLQP